MVATVAAAVLIAHQVASKALRDAWFLGHHSASELPWAMFASAVLAIPFALFVGRWMTKVGPARATAHLLLVHTGLFAMEWLLAPTLPELVSWALYLHVGALGPLVVSAFWSIINERFDPRSAKHFMLWISGGATFGGVLGGVLAERISRHLSIDFLFALLATISLATAFSLWRVGTVHDGCTPPSSAPSAYAIIRSNGYLKAVGTAIGLTAIMGTLLDYAMKAAADASFGSTTELMSFFSLFYTFTGLATFFVQSATSRGTIRRWGVVGALSTLPLAVLAAGAIATLFAQFWTLVLVRAAQSILENSTFRSAYELLYTPLRPNQKRSTKPVLDVVFLRAGDVLGSAVLFAVVPWWSTQTPVLCVALAMGASVLLLGVVRSLHRGYVRTLGERLRDGQLDLESPGGLEPAVRDSVAHAIDHGEVLGIDLDPAMLRQAMHALTHDDPRIRGTAAEYLDNVLPDSIRTFLWPFMDEGLDHPRRVGIVRPHESPHLP